MKVSQTAEKDRNERKGEEVGRTVAPLAALDLRNMNFGGTRAGLPGLTPVEETFIPQFAALNLPPDEWIENIKKAIETKQRQYIAVGQAKADADLKLLLKELPAGTSVETDAAETRRAVNEMVASFALARAKAENISPQELLQIAKTSSLQRDMLQRVRDKAAGMVEAKNNAALERSNRGKELQNGLLALEKTELVQTLMKYLEVKGSCIYIGEWGLKSAAESAEVRLTLTGKGFRICSPYYRPCEPERVFLNKDGSVSESKGVKGWCKFLLGRLSLGKALPLWALEAIAAAGLNIQMTKEVVQDEVERVDRRFALGLK